MILGHATPDDPLLDLRHKCIGQVVQMLSRLELRVMEVVGLMDQTLPMGLVPHGVSTVGGHAESQVKIVYEVVE